MMKSSVVVGLFSLIVSATASAAVEIPVQARFFAGMTGVKLDELNDSLEAQSMKKIEGVTQLGLEITYPVMKYLDVGARYAKKLADSEENPADPNTDYSAKIDQDAFLLIARVPIIREDFYRVDAFAGVGGTNTKVTMKTLAQNGDYTKSVGESWYASPYAAAGVSLALGYKRFYFVFEGAIEHNKVDDLKRSGSVSTSVNSLDLSGSYFTVGIMFDGIPGTVGR
ncbi:hypothetical protein Bb109J_c1309 [Bdellovibrio bacteriovorus]|uniref:hypothetical protein n=1 Tax=Bdellovibrio bacteriovorus TaxID=959 RepID=UPI00045C00FC|nr:hypothetical protein [Bdellovibrio bacteriovorus]AHZ84006.1 hypothetical protein EP01_03485 [Bdellovibrio bacteriovorus]BEV67889.1 hypothetical protein Bb109J_c1309 [Bdellovibrio bacteriovorus]